MKLLAVLSVASDHVHFPACYISISRTLPIVQKSHFTQQEYCDASETGYVYCGWCTLENYQQEKPGELHAWFYNKFCGLIYIEKKSHQQLEVIVFAKRLFGFSNKTDTCDKSNSSG